MEKQIKQKSAPFANLPMWLKFVTLLLSLVIIIGLFWTAMMRTVRRTQQEKFEHMQKTAVTAAEQIMNMSVETAVSIAKNIYTNEAIYEFLNTRYESASSYYETYYPLQQNTAMNLAETNIVKRCTIYTENPTVLTGGNIQKLEPFKESYWFQSFQKMGKPTILCINPETSSLVLVRKLDYRSLETGDSYVCLEMNRAIMSQFVENLGFEGKLYVISGSDLLYSSLDTVKTVDEVDITQNFECLTRNYYTVDIEFYSYAERSSYGEFFVENQWILLGLGLSLVLIFVFCFSLFLSIRSRISPVLRQYAATGEIRILKKGKNGRDEIGQLLDVCSEMANHIASEGDASKQNSESLMRQSSAYNSLFLTAMRQDAELTVLHQLPDLKLEKNDQLIPLQEEAELLKKIAAKLGAHYECDDFPEGSWMVPAYSFVLIANEIFRRYIDPSVTITFLDDTAFIAFESPKTPKALDILKIRAIFEDSKISEVYDFDRSYRFNPYMRLKACMGNDAEIEIHDKIMFRLVFKLKQKGGTT